MIQSQEPFGSGGLMIANGCNGSGLPLCWLFVQCSLALCSVLRGDGKFGKRIILVLKDYDVNLRCKL